MSIDGSNYAMTWNQETPDRLYIGDRERGTTCIQASAGVLHGTACAYATLPAGHVVGWNDALRNAIESFYEELRGNANERFARLEDGDRIVRIVEACLTSSESGQWVEVS